MSEMLNCARNIRNLAVLYRDMDQAAKVLEELGSVEQAKREMEAAAAVARGELDGLNAKVDALKQHVAQASTQANVLVAKAQAQAEELLQNARKTAEMQAAETIKAGQDEAARLVAQASTEKARLSSEIGGLQKSIVDLKGEIADLQSSKAEAELQKAKVLAQLDDLKGKLKSVLG